MATVRGGAWVEISQGNLNNGHFYLNRMGDFFPADAVGGPNEASASPHKLNLQFSTGERVLCDIAGDKLILRDRGATRRLFEAEGAKPGDLVLVEKTGERSFAVRVQRLRP